MVFVYLYCSKLHKLIAQKGGCGMAEMIESKQIEHVQVSRPVIDLVKRAGDKKDHDRWFDEPSHEHWGDDD